MDIPRSVFGVLLTPALFTVCTGHAAAAPGGVTTRASVGNTGAQANAHSGLERPALSSDGRFVAFASRADNLVAGDTNSGDAAFGLDVFVRDRYASTTVRASVSSAGVEGNDGADSAVLSDDGRFVAFRSSASNHVSGDTNGESDVFVRDLATATTTRVDVDSAGAQADGHSTEPAISGDGRYVAFTSRAGNLVAGDTNGHYDVFVHDLVTGATERVSVGNGGAQANSASRQPSLSRDGRYVAFHSDATNLVAGDANGDTDVFVRDRVAGTTVRVSVDSANGEADGPSTAPSISADGRYVAFVTLATNLVPGHADQVDLVVRDLAGGTTERVGTSTPGPPSDPVSGPRISADGLFVAFDSDRQLVPADTNALFDVYVRDRTTGAIVRANVRPDGSQSFSAKAPAISADGRYTGFVSFASDLVPGDTNGATDTFVRDADATGFESACHPGVAGTMSCPCSNPPSAVGRGCDNSSATGGARLSAAGASYLSMDSLVFAASGEKPTALSIVLQGHTLNSSGAVYGQGVRCVSDALKRLYTKSASAGSITAPDFGAGDAPVHTRSVALGDPIAAGAHRSYLVYYRDASVLGGCPSTATFNATQSGEIVWQP